MKLTLVGSGVRSPGVVRDLAKYERELGLTEVVLHDADRERLDVMAALCAHLCRSEGATFLVRGEPDLPAALAGASVVYAAIRVGQERARTVDERIPLAHGVLGQETTGPGGFAMAMRTIPTMLDIAHLVEDLAPDALVVNFTNPVGVIVQALSDHSRVRIVGVCDGPPAMTASLASFLGVPASAIHVGYFGLNHLGWIHRAVVDGSDRISEIVGRFEELRRSDPETWGLFDPELVRALGMLPMEYLYFYYYRNRAVDHIASSGGTRGEQIAALADWLWPELRRRVDAGDVTGALEIWGRSMRTRGSTYFARERGEAVTSASTPAWEGPGVTPVGEGGYGRVATAVIAAAITGRGGRGFILDVPNQGAMPDLRRDDVVEVTCTVDERGVHPLEQGPLPAAALALVQSVKTYERLTVEAAVEGSYSKALQALVVHPLVGSYPTARAILDEYASAHAEYLAHVGRPRQVAC